MSTRKRGRPPSIWHAEPGKAFLYAVFKVQSERHPIKTVDAINIVVKRPEFRYLDERYSRRYLEKKYQEMSQSNPFTHMHKEHRRAEYLRAIYRNK
jgi:hypothetical protein